MSVKLTFWVRPSQKNAQNRVPIYLRIQQDSKRSQYSIGEYIDLIQWDKKAQKVKGNSVEAQAMNSKLDTLKARALKICNELLLSGEPFNAFTVKDKLVNGLTKAAKLQAARKFMQMHEILCFYVFQHYPDILAPLDANRLVL